MGNATVSKYINEKVEALEKEKKLLLEANQLSMIDGLEDSEVFRIISIAANWNTLELDEKKAIVSQLIEAVNITDDSLVITWKKPFDVL